MVIASEEPLGSGKSKCARRKRIPIQVDVFLITFEQRMRFAVIRIQLL